MERFKLTYHLIIGILKNKSDVLVLIGEYNKALQELDKVYLVADIVQHQMGEVGLIEKSEIHISRCWIYKTKGQMDKAANEGEIGLKIIDDLEFFVNKELLQNLSAVPQVGTIKNRLNLIKATGFNNLGIIFYDKGEYDEAFEFFQKYLEIAQKIEDKKTIGIAANNLGLIYDAKGEYDKAIELYQESITLSEEVGNKPMIGLTNNNLGYIYQMMGHCDKAIEHYLKYLRTSEEIGQKLGIALASSNLGGSFLEISG
ncbi:MAG: tetratricopeptide repeat protein [Candidatus Edwardsbacteria bacterium]